MVPSIVFNRRDNQLGIQIGNPDHNALAVVGNCSGGTQPLNTPAFFSRVQDVSAAFGTGPLAEFAWFAIENFGIGLVLVQCGFTTAGGYANLDTSGVTGASVVTSHAATHPFDEYDEWILIVNGGTVGVTGITYQLSGDAGLTYGPVAPLGTATTIIDTARNVQVDLTAASLNTGDVIKVRTSQPIWNDAQLDASLLTLQQTQQTWDAVLILGPALASDVAAVETRMGQMEAAELERMAILNVRSPTLTGSPGVVETESAYLTAQQTAFLNTVALHCSVGYAYERATSPISFSQYRRPCSWLEACKFATTRPGRDLAAVADGSFPSTVQITDKNGNPQEHDELFFSGADDARFTTNRSWRGRQGVYLNNARLMSAAGSDYVFVQFLRVSNLVCALTRSSLQLIESLDILVDPNSGFILEEEARDIESGLNFVLKTNVVDTRDATSVTAKVNRTDNLLSTFKLTGSVTIVSLAYPKQIVFDIGFKNPVRNVVPVLA